MLPHQTGPWLIATFTTSAKIYSTRIVIVAGLDKIFVPQKFSAIGNSKNGIMFLSEHLYHQLPYTNVHVFTCTCTCTCTLGMYKNNNIMYSEFMHHIMKELLLKIYSIWDMQKKQLQSL